MANLRVATNLLDSPAHSGPGKFGRLLAQYIAPLGVDLLPSHTMLSDIDAYMGSAVIGENIINYAKQNDVPIILRLDGVGEIYPHGTYNNDFPRVKYSHANADHVIYQSQFAEKYVQDATRFCPRSSSVILNGILMPPMLDYFDCESRKYKFISICNNWNKFRYDNFHHAIYKNLPHIIRAFPDFKWTIVGKHDEFKNITQPNPHIEWVEFCKDLNALRQQSGAVIHLVGKDSCPNSLIESMSHGLPSIVWHESGGPEIAGDAGVVLENYDHQPVIKAIQTIHDNYQQMSYRAYHGILERCSVLDTAIQYKKAIEICLEQQS